MPVWDPARYLQFADDRARPFLDLIEQIPTKPDSIVDLGCGPGHLTRHLRARWPDAEVLGIDSSTEMIERAIADNTDHFANYDVGDVADWVPHRPVDLFLSNAAFQWVPNQFEVITRLLGHLSDTGSVAIQVPDNSDSAAHQALVDLADRPAYRDALSEVRRLPRIDPHEYLAFFAGKGLEVNAWSTTYLHVLHEPDPVFDWISGTGARPYLEALDDDLRAAFEDDLRALLTEAYPAQDYGTVFPFRRTFAVATLSALGR
ncbi:methyltransferase domain-containing protein [Gordonia sp. ABSL1-1]|uniref:methyltransferase domain-containing protein n=1 Tax=Gordonia sp. ABSL1-1 TaxID=3053923 RepID=UPI002572E1AD|nr:methyltransferase domain-containing protein [Gordonia sp. ABSL1-1]MDL9935235.1 methyltransferase domain-containing protein [Gordonia sp. ABSL1-1]